MKSIIYILLIVVPFNLLSQEKKITIINTDTTIANTNKHPEYWRLLGNVVFKHNNTQMFCDSAYHFLNENKIKAFGNITINQGDSIMLYGEALTYYGNINNIEIRRNVRLIDNSMTLSTQLLNYNLHSNIGHYPNKGIIKDSDKTITSKNGEYYSNQHKFIFQDSVILKENDYTILTNNMHYLINNQTTLFFGPSYIISNNKTIYCEKGWYNTNTNISQFEENNYVLTKNYILRGDSLYYNQNTKYGKAINNIELIDTTQNITIFGDLAEYFENNETTKITKSPYLELIEDTDTLFVSSDLFINKRTKQEQIILAYNNVKLFKRNLQGKCDSLSYDMSKIKMIDNPILWAGNYQITADTIELFITKNNINKVLLRTNPMIISKEDSTDYNQIKGKEIIIFFKEKEIYKIDAIGNGQSILVVNDDDKNRIGLNYIESSEISLLFKNNEINHITYKSTPISITTPYNDLQEDDRFLKGFLSRYHERPLKKENIIIQ